MKIFIRFAFYKDPSTTLVVTCKISIDHGGRYDIEMAYLKHYVILINLENPVSISISNISYIM